MCACGHWTTDMTVCVCVCNVCMCSSVCQIDTVCKSQFSTGIVEELKTALRTLHAGSK